ncbi:hypothetical protein M413DRAFT_386037 [Hebeloma cylindrosporum]|uniref:Uncharacterized protein n=1 Tax=Hebeloma cylindrosporum TaxID=76867 RepID=A0A0C3CIZ6_HEBCY|nr:hypothetical protein M413DRAFT_386037 [Hebeloma cylindrosporum h7]
MLCVNMHHGAQGFLRWARFFYMKGHMYHTVGKKTRNKINSRKKVPTWKSHHRAILYAISFEESLSFTPVGWGAKRELIKVNRYNNMDEGDEGGNADQRRYENGPGAVAVVEWEGRW